MTLVSTKKALEFFEAKMEFTTGPVELKDMMGKDENINIIDVRLPEDFAKGHIPGALNLSKNNWDSFSEPKRITLLMFLFIILEPLRLALKLFR